MIEPSVLSIDNVTSPRLARDTPSRRLSGPPVRREVIRTLALGFMDMPELLLTVRQAARFWSIDIDTCQRALDELVDIGFLVCERSNQYTRRCAR